MSARLLLTQRGLQLVARPGDARSNRSDRDPADLGRERVGQADDLREHERLAAFRRERVEQQLDRHGLRRLRRQSFAAPARLDRAPALRAAHCIGADAARDREQPHPPRGPALESRQRPDGTRVRLLHQVADIVAPTEIRAVAPDVPLRVADEGRERGPIARRGRAHDVFVVVHDRRSYGVEGLGNQTRPDSDWCSMECSQAREALSAVLDGEPTVETSAALAAHVRTCGDCGRYLERARALDALTHAVRADAPDLTARVLETARTQRHRPDPWTTSLRLGLLAVAIAQLGLALPGLIYGTDEGAPIHIAHEVGAWDLALAVAFVFAAWRPLRAVGLLPFAAALSAGLVLTAIFDVADGRAVALTETTHLLELVGTALLYLIMAPRKRPGPALRLAPASSRRPIV
jgi:predicted anti-sigma-YlaC factor YlaD